MSIYGWQTSGSAIDSSGLQAGAGPEICLVAARKATITLACSPAARAEAEGVAITSLPSATVALPAVAGLVPDGVTQVLAIEGGREQPPIAVVHNAFYVEGPDLEGVRYALPAGGTRTIRITAAPPQPARGEAGTVGLREFR